MAIRLRAAVKVLKLKHNQEVLYEPYLGLNHLPSGVYIFHLKPYANNRVQNIS